MLYVPVIVEIGPLRCEDDADLVVSRLENTLLLDAVQRNVVTLLSPGLAEDYPAIHPRQSTKERRAREGEGNAPPDDAPADVDGIELPAFPANPEINWFVTFADAWPGERDQLLDRAALLWDMMETQRVEGVWFEDVAGFVGVSVEVHIKSGDLEFMLGFGDRMEDVLRDVLARDGAARVALFQHSETFTVDDLAGHLVRRHACQ
jgi:hypothetical protein